MNKKLITTLAGILTYRTPRSNVIIFESNPDFSDNTYWFFKYLSENTDVLERYKSVWAVKSKEDMRDMLCGRKIDCILAEPETTADLLKNIRYTYNAKFIVDSNKYIHKKHTDQKRVFLGHGMPLKIVKSYDLKKGKVDMNTITSYNFNRHFYDIGDTDENMRNFGYCRTDILANNMGKRKNRDTSYIVWMPTYRQHKKGGELAIENNFPLGLPVIKSHEDMAEINEYLKEYNTVLYLRPHPAQDTSVMHLDEMSNIIIADNDYINKRGIQLYEFLTETDALITDYSSVYYDYLMIDRPIALAIEDLDDFSAKWPMFYDDFKANYKCQYLYTVDDLKTFIKNTAEDNDEYASERKKERERFFDHPDNKVCERVYNFMKTEYGL